MKIFELNKKSTNLSYIKGIADLHIKAFPDFFLTRLGKNFLTTLYKSYLEDENSGIIVAEGENNKLVGFIAYSKDYSGFYKGLIKKHLLKFGFEALCAVIQHPFFIKKLFSALKKSDEVKRTEAYVELASIGVDPDVSRCGVGSKLIEHLVKTIDFREYAYISLETDAEGNDNVNKFYQKKNFILYRSYLTVENRKMNEYHLLP